MSPKTRNQRRAKAQFARIMRERTVERILEEEQAKQQQKQYLEGVNQKRDERLTKTVFVANVRDLDVEYNFQTLRSFIETNYGPLEVYTKERWGRSRGGQKSYPRARLVFQKAVDAQKLFGGTVLAQVSGPALIRCSLGCKQGMITVHAAKQRYADSWRHDEALKGEVICFQAKSLALGHYCPDDHDMYWNTVDEAHEFDAEEWVEEICLRQTCQVQVDLLERTFEISTAYKPSAASHNDPDDLAKIFGLSALLADFGNPTDTVMSFRFKELRHHIEICKESDDAKRLSLIFVLKHPPKIENIVPDLCLSGLDDREPQRVRCISYPGIDRAFFNRCRAFKLSLDECSLSQLSRHERFTRLFDFGLLRKTLRPYRTAIDDLIHSLRSIVMTSKELCAGLARLHQYLRKVHDTDDRAGIILRAALDQRRFSWYHLLRDQDSSGTLCDTIIDSLVRGKAMQVLRRVVDTDGGCTKHPLKLYQTVAAETVTDAELVTSIPDYCLQIPRLLLTPCQETVLGYETEMSNRVLRDFVNTKGFSPSSFMRASVADENGQQLFGIDLSREVESLFKSILLSGLKINGHTYQFLAYSSSQLKECSLWLVKPEGNWTVKRMRHEFGDFSHCKSASKYAARVGQCFSTTYKSISAGYTGSRFGGARLQHALIPDIPGQGHFLEKFHTDGTGVISRALMDELLRQVPFGPKDPRDTSIIQIRYGGAKGTLTAWDAPTMTKLLGRSGMDVLLRESMIKFDTAYEEIEICAVGKSIPYYLNRNVILILSCLGISDVNFLNIQRKMLDDLDAMLVSSDKARELLPRLLGPDTTIRSVLHDMLSSGLEPQDEPFLFSCLHAIRSHHLFALRKKTRIFVADGAVLRGGIDESGMLPEGCVYVHRAQCREPGASGDEGVVLGPVLVTKHPVMHVGDVRMLCAVNVPALRHHRNIILFSQKGIRPEPDKMAGSDLDGDEFAVTWDARLFLRGWDTIPAPCPSDSLSVCASYAMQLQCFNQAPLDYADPTGTPPEFPNEFEAQNQALVEHFIKHAKTNNLGRIAMLWQDHASRSGANCSQCHELARLHSIAVDFPKSGIPASLPDSLLLKRDQERAHWREQKRYPVFICQNVVGRLYDEVIRRDVTDRSMKALKAFAGRDSNRYGQILPYCSRRDSMQQLEAVYDSSIPTLLGFNDENDALLTIGSEHYEWYEEEVASLVNRFKINCEGELTTGCIRKLHKLHRRREHEVSEEIRRTLRQIRIDYRRRFAASVLRLIEVCTTWHEGDALEAGYSEDLIDSVFEIATSKSANHFDAKQLMLRQTAFRLAAAYYIVAYSLDWREQGNRISVRFGFPWVVCSDVIYAGLLEASHRN
ncbi:hypothetical protein MPSEU_000354500 [Mayamaea pseudoterrestris]|nr:hypothetical protein MPSEU_000354500 [Mayamaea pseudoterrestris]